MQMVFRSVLVMLPHDRPADIGLHEPWFGSVPLWRARQLLDRGVKGNLDNPAPGRTGFGQIACKTESGL